MKVFRNIDLIGIERQKNISINGYNIIIYRDDVDSVGNDYLIDNELAGGTFKELK